MLFVYGTIMVMKKILFHSAIGHKYLSPTDNWEPLIGTHNVTAKSEEANLCI
jgi:hypothetical protein